MRFLEDQPISEQGEPNIQSLAESWACLLGCKRAGPTGESISGQEKFEHPMSPESVASFWHLVRAWVRWSGPGFYIGF